MKRVVHVHVLIARESVCVCSVFCVQLMIRAIIILLGFRKGCRQLLSLEPCTKTANFQPELYEREEDVRREFKRELIIKCHIQKIVSGFVVQFIFV